MIRPLLFALLLSVAAPVQAAVVYVERLEVTLTPEPDGRLLVEEVYTYDFRRQPVPTEHFRDVSLTPPEPARSPLRTRSVQLDEVTITAAGGTTTLTPEVTDQTARLTWPLDPATATYTLRYRVVGALSYPNHNETELVWSATGIHPQSFIQSVTVAVADPYNLLVSGRSCVVARTDQLDSCQGLTSDTTAARFFTRLIEPGDEVIITQSLDPTKVAYKTVESVRVVAWVGGALASLALLLIWFPSLVPWRRKPATAVQPDFKGEDLTDAV
jgi:hypothetical protein